MASSEVPTLITLKAAADYSAATAQYKMGKIDSNGDFLVASAAGQQIDAINQDRGIAGAAIQCALPGGRVKVQLGGTVAPGDKVTNDNAGRAVAVASGERAVGTIVQGGTVGTVGSMLFYHTAEVG